MYLFVYLCTLFLDRNGFFFLIVVAVIVVVVLSLARNVQILIGVVRIDSKPTVFSVQLCSRVRCCTAPTPALSHSIDMSVCTVCGVCGTVIVLSFS